MASNETLPLNPVLYQQVQKLGSVRIVNQGQHRVEVTNPSGGYPVVLQRGEHYQVNCPFCDDTKGKLSICYRYGLSARETRLWHCYRRSCEKALVNRQQLEMRLRPPPQALLRQRQIIHQLPAAEAKTLPEPVIWPDNWTPLDHLPPSHPAVEYVRGRGFDHRELAQEWQVGFVMGAENCHPQIFHRLVFPLIRLPDQAVGFGWELAGWQARTIPMPPGGEGSPKYLNSQGLRKAELLYGLERAITTSGSTLLVEGATDVWKAGPSAVAVLGKTISPKQIELIRQHLAGRPLVIMLDADAYQDAGRMASSLRNALRNTPIFLASLASDPGELDRTAIWQAAGAAHEV